MPTPCRPYADPMLTPCCNAAAATTLMLHVPVHAGVSSCLPRPCSALHPLSACPRWGLIKPPIQTASAFGWINDHFTNAWRVVCGLAQTASTRPPANVDTQHAPPANPQALLRDVCVRQIGESPQTKRRATFNLKVKQTASMRKAPAKKLATCGVYTSTELETRSLEKSGYLMKRCGKIPQWKRRWMVLRDGELLFYHKREEEADGEGNGGGASTLVSLDDFVSLRVLPSEASTELSRTFEIVCPQRTYQMMASSPSEMETWVQCLLKAKNTRARVNSSSLQMGGWLSKSRHGFVKKRWCTLVGRTLFYSTARGSKPRGSIRLTGHVQIACADPDSDTDEQGAILGDDHYCISITGLNGQYFLLTPSKPERDKWLFFLQMASGSLPENVGTDTEMILRRLNNELSLESEEFKRPIFKYADHYEGPLTTMMTAELETAASEIWKSISLYTGVVIKAQAAEYHVLLAQSIIEQCLLKPELQNEVFCMLIKQTNGHADPGSGLHIQCWQLLTLCIPIFLPCAFFLRHLELHLMRCATDSTRVGKYAEYAFGCLGRHIENGGRKSPPSRAEIIAIVLRDPFRYLQPLSAPVRLATGSEFLVGFDSSTTFQEFSLDVSASLGIRPPKETGFAVFSSVHGSDHLVISEKPGRKVCDALFEWEKKAKLASVGLLESSLVPTFSFARRLYFASHEHTASKGTEDILLVFQTFAQIMARQFDVCLDDAITLGTIVAQLEGGNLDAQDDAKAEVGGRVQRCVPAPLRNPSLTDEPDEDGPERLSSKEITERFESRWHGLADVPSASGPHLDLSRAPCGLYGVKFIDLVSLW